MPKALWILIQPEISKIFFVELARTLYAPLLSAIEESPFHDTSR
jgi:hypothetical protein